MTTASTVKPGAGTANKTVEAGASALELARRITLKMLDGIPADKLCHQPIPGTNHAVWVLGHMACTDDYFLTSLGGAKPILDESWLKLFGWGSKPCDDARAYPPIDEVKAAAKKTRAALITWVESMDDAKLATAFTGGMASFAPDYASLAISIAWHEGFHAGQISAVRRSLGLPSAVDG